ncbi:MAG: PhzF family phenazine biosynthesis protein [Proteobacteria bacterium]|nr:PhzF family phenazine biosynthesis protein [Pseudomonadota bacterium]
MKLPFYQVDAFTNRVFGGNPAGVCPLDSWLDYDVMQAIAAENNLAETAFFVAGPDRYHLRWFTPTTEVDLCGHATLASAWVLFEQLGIKGSEVSFDTRSGVLTVRKSGDLLSMDFPSRPGAPATAPAGLEAGLGINATEVLKARDYMVVFDSEEEVRAIRPDFAELVKVDTWGIIATAPGKDSDFVSRFFAPGHGVPEDPVTGSSHCTLIPYWAKRLGRSKLKAHQVSARGGELFCEDLGARVSIAGRAALYLEGSIHTE